MNVAGFIILVELIFNEYTNRFSLFRDLNKMFHSKNRHAPQVFLVAFRKKNAKHLSQQFFFWYLTQTYWKEFRIIFPNAAQLQEVLCEHIYFEKKFCACRDPGIGLQANMLRRCDKEISREVLMTEMMGDRRVWMDQEKAHIWGLAFV